MVATQCRSIISNSASGLDWLMYVGERGDKEAMGLSGPVQQGAVNTS